MNWRIAADYKAACILFGLKAQSSCFPCVWCLLRKYTRAREDRDTERNMKDMLERVALAKEYCTSDENILVEAIDRAIRDPRVSYLLLE